MSNEIRGSRSEINRLTKAIAAEEQNINQTFQRIGQTYFAAHRQDPEESQRANIQTILDAMRRANGYKDQINVLRGIAICPNCRAEVDSKAAFCSHCGTRMPNQAPPAQPAAPNAPICPNCGNVCAPGTRFCNLCGTRLPEAAPAAPVQPAPNYAPAYAPVPEPVPVYNPAPEPVPAYAPIPEPVREPIPEPVFQPIPEPINQPIPEPVNQPIPEPVNQPIPEPVNQPMTAPEAAPEPNEPVAKKFCANCGAPLEPGYRFCLECGTPVQ